MPYAAPIHVPQVLQVPQDPMSDSKSRRKQEEEESIIIYIIVQLSRS